jgi:hypothetical protein
MRVRLLRMAGLLAPLVNYQNIFRNFRASTPHAACVAPGSCLFASRSQDYAAAFRTSERCRGRQTGQGAPLRGFLFFQFRITFEPQSSIRGAKRRQADQRRSVSPGEPSPPQVSSVGRDVPHDRQLSSRYLLLANGRFREMAISYNRSSEQPFTVPSNAHCPSFATGTAARIVSRLPADDKQWV